MHVNSSSGENIFRAQVNGNTKLLVSSNGGVSIGRNINAPTNGLYVLGNVGINTNTPTYSLDGNGSARVQYGLIINQGLTIGDGGIWAINTSVTAL